MEHMTSRDWVRKIAEAMTDANEWPTADKVRIQIGEATNQALNPSNTTVHDELKRWFADTFWPRSNAFKVIAEPGIPESLAKIYKEGFQLIVQGALAAAESNWSEESAELRKSLAAALENVEAYVAEREKLIEANDDLVGKLELASMNSTLVEEQKARLETELASANDRIRGALEREAGHERAMNELRQDAQLRIDAEMKRSDEERRAMQLQIDRDRQVHKQTEADRVRMASERELEHQKRLEAEAAGHRLTQEVATLKETFAAQLKDREAQLQQLVREVKAGTQRVTPPAKKRAPPRTALSRNRKS